MQVIEHTLEVHGVPLKGRLQVNSKGECMAILMDTAGKVIKAKELARYALLKFAKDYENCRPGLRVGMWWALLGYDALKWRNAKPLATTECHPGAVRCA